MDDKYFKETTVRIFNLIRQYPYANLIISIRAILAFYELLQTLHVLKSKDPVMSSALITLPHRISNKSVISSEQIIKEIVKSFRSNASTEQKNVVIPLSSSKTVKILRELDNLQDMIYAMPYDIDLLDPHWFKAIQESIFRVEAPTLFSYTLNKDRKADFDTFLKILAEMQHKGLLQLESDGLELTRLGCMVKYKNVFDYVERIHPNIFITDRNYLSNSLDIRKFHQGDSYKDLNVRRTLRSLIKKGKGADQVLKEDLRVYNVSSKKHCILVLAIDHSWSMARCRKLQYAKDSAAGLVFAVKKNRDKIALISFSDEASVLSRPTNKYESLIRHITSLRPEKETNIADVFLKAFTLFSASGKNLLRHLILLTDGIPTISGQEFTRNELENRITYEVRKMRKMGITISVICIRDDLEENDTSLAKRIAYIGGGAFSLVNTQDLLNHILRDYSNVKLKETS